MFESAKPLNMIVRVKFAHPLDRGKSIRDNLKEMLAINSSRAAKGSIIKISKISSLV